MKATQDIGLLLTMAVLMTPLPATAQTSLPTSASVQQSPQQTLSMGQSPQNYEVLHVNVVTGSDQQGTGSADQPYQTITQALHMAPTTSTVILLAPGHYSQETGEQFPLRLRPGITIQGNAGETRNTLIVGGGEAQMGDATHNAAIVTADRSGLANILVSNAKGSGVWITAGEPILRRVALVSNAVAGVQVTNGAPIVEHSYFHDNQYGLTLQGDGHALVRGNYFEATGRAITVASPATPTIHNNRIARNHVGIALKNNARPRLDANVLNSNGRNGVVEVEPTAATAATVPASNTPTDREVAVLTQPQAVAQTDTATGRDTSSETAVETVIEPDSETASEPGEEFDGGSDSESGTTIAVNLPAASQADIAVSAVTANVPNKITVPTATVTGNVNAAAFDSMSVNRPETVDEVAVSEIASSADDADDLALREPLPLSTAPTIAAAPAPISATEPVSSPSNARASTTPTAPTMTSALPPAAIESRQADLPKPDLEEVMTSADDETAVTDASENVTVETIAPESIPVESIMPESIAPEIGTTDSNLAERDPADEAITIAVIPASGPEQPHNNPVNPDNPESHGRRAGIASLLARLNSTLEAAPVEDNETLGLTSTAPTPQGPSVPSVPTVDIPASNQRLPVPSVAIPSRGGSLNFSPPGTVALAETFRYRVLVDMSDADDLARLVPDAFRTSVGSRMFMQAGAYIDEVDAQERLEWLRENGIEGRVDLRN